MSHSPVRKKEIYQPAFTAIYVWLSEQNEEFEVYVKKNLMLTLGWAAKNNDLKELIQLNNGNTDKVSAELIAIFKKETDGNISYLHDVLGAEKVQLMVETIISFIAAAVTNKSEQFTNILR